MFSTKILCFVVFCDSCTFSFGVNHIIFSMLLFSYQFKLICVSICSQLCSFVNMVPLLLAGVAVAASVEVVKNGGPREESTHVGSAGVVRGQAVAVSPCQPRFRDRVR